MTEQLNILLVDDHQLILDSLSAMLTEREGFCVAGTAKNGRAALEFLAKNPVDFVLMDLNMPEMNGLDACRRIKIDFPSLPVLILSMLSEIKLIQNVVNAGANGYLLKNAGIDEIASAIEKVASGERHFDSRITDLLLDNKEQTRNQAAEIMPSLSRREKEILQLIIRELTTAEIAEKLFIAAGTVESHRRNMMSKLGVRNTAGLVSKAYEYGILG